MIVCTSRCCAASWTSRCRRRRVSSAVATTRDREAVSLALFSALAERGGDERRANCWRRLLGAGGKRSVRRRWRSSIPHTSPSTEIGAATAAASPYGPRARVALAAVVVDADHAASRRTRSGSVSASNRDARARPVRARRWWRRRRARRSPSKRIRRHGLVAEQLRRFGRDGGEDLLRDRAACDELGDAPQRGLLVGQRPAASRARLALAIAVATRLGEHREAVLGVAGSGRSRAEHGDRCPRRWPSVMIGAPTPLVSPRSRAVVAFEPGTPS